MSNSEDARPDLGRLVDALRRGIAEELWDDETKEAVARLLAARRFDVLVDAVSDAPPGSGVGALLRRALAAPRTLRRLLADPDASEEAVERVLEWSGPEAAEVVAGLLADREPPDPGLLIRALGRMGLPAERAIGERWGEFPDSVRKRLLATIVEVDALVERGHPVGELAEDLLDVLAEEESRAVRREVFDRLVGLGSRVAPLIQSRLDDPRWTVRRNLLRLLAELRSSPRGFSALDYLEDRSEDPRVRLEALKVALLDPGERRDAVRAGLADPDERVLHLALAALEDRDVEVLAPLVLRRARDPELSESVRAAAVRALAPVETAEVRDFLVDIAGETRPMLGYRLAETTRVSLAALSVLAERWADDAVARRLLEKARRSDDREVRRAVATAGGSGSSGAVG